MGSDPTLTPLWHLAVQEAQRGASAECATSAARIRHGCTTTRNHWNFSPARRMQPRRRMPTTAFELHARTAMLLCALERVAASVSGGDRGNKLAHTLLTSCRDMDAGYRHACASSTPDEFVGRISHVARHAKRTKATLMLLTQLEYLPLAETRELIVEARGLANIFVDSRNTAKRRRKLKLG